MDARTRTQVLQKRSQELLMAEPSLQHHPNGASARARTHARTHTHTHTHTHTVGFLMEVSAGERVGHKCLQPRLKARTM